MTTARTLATFAALAAGALVAAAPAQSATLEEILQRGTIRIAVANEIPYGYVDPISGDAMGAGPDVAARIAEQLGIDVEWVQTGFSSLIPGLQADRFDVVAAEMAILPERCQQIIYSEPNTSYGEGLLVPTGNPKDIHSYSDFAERTDLRIAILAGADQLQMLQDLGVDEGRIVTIANNADAISTVATGRADAYAGTGLTVSGLAGQSPNVEVVADFVDPVIDGEEVRSWGGFAFAQDSETLRDAFNETLAEFKATAEWREVIGAYGFTETDMNHSTDRATADLCAAE